MKVFELYGDVNLKDGDVKSKLDGIDKKAEGAGIRFDKLKGIVGKAGKAMAVGIGAGVTAMTGFVMKAAATTDEIDKQSQKIGISRQAYQEYSYVLSQNGTDVQVLQRGMKTLTERMEESVIGAGKGAEAFEILNLSATGLNGELKSQEEMFDETARALMQMPEGAEKSSLAFELFGRAGQELMPLLNGTEEDMDALREAAHEMGLVLSDEAIDAGAAFTDSVDDVKRSLGAVVSNIGAELMPMFQTFLDWVLAHMPEIQEVIKVVFEKIGEFVTVAIDIFQEHLLPVFKTVLDWVQANMPAIQKTFETVWNAVSKAVSVAVDIISGIINTFIGLFTGDWERMTEGIKTLWSGMWEGIKTIVSGAWGLIKTAFGTLYEGISGWFTDLISDAITWGSDMVKGLWEGIKDVKEWLLDKIGEWVTEITDKIKKFFGIASPSKLMAKYGNYINEGLAKGIDENKSKPINAMQRLGEAIDKAFNKIQGKIKQTTGFIDKKFTLWQLRNKDLEGSSKELEMQLEMQTKKQGLLAESIEIAELALEKIIATYGEASEEAMRYKEQLLDLQIEHQGLTNEINNSANAMERMQDIRSRNLKAINEFNIMDNFYKGNSGSREENPHNAYNPKSTDPDDQYYFSEIDGKKVAFTSPNNFREVMGRAMDRLGDKFVGSEVGDYFAHDQGKGKYGISDREFNEMLNERGINKNSRMVQNVTINSPKHLNPSETARQLKNASRQLAREW